MNSLNEYIDINAFLGSLPYMGKGMLGIFIITAVIIIAVLLINKIGNIKND